MTDSAPPRARGFTITREFSAPRELVWAAWTDPTQLASWFGPRGLSTPRKDIAIDLRPGGSWQITMVADADGTEYPQIFTFLEVVEPERLVFSAVASGIHDPRVVITLKLRPAASGTEMTFAVEGLPDDDSTSDLEQGWSSSFDCLAELLDEVLT